MRQWLQCTLFVLACFVTTLMMPPLVHAQDDAEEEPAKEPTKEELAAARDLFNQAKDLEAINEWGRALANLERVAKIVSTPQVRFHIALCHENLGRWVEAINGFELAAQEAQKVGAEDVIANAPPRAEALRARVAHLVLDISGKVRVSKVYLDDRQVSLALAGTRIPVDPGEHRIEVRRNGKVTYEMDVEVGEAESHKLEIRIDDPKPIETPDPVPDPVPVAPPVKPETEMKRLPAYILAGVGVLSFAGSGVFWGLRQSNLNGIAANCEDGETFTGCNPEDEGPADRARAFDTTAKVLLGVGAASLASGVVLWFVLAPNKGTPTTGTKTKVTIVPTLGGVLLNGQF